jgi:hypothetical protein
MDFEQRIINELERELDVVDVYTSLGRVYVLNTYDLEPVARYIDNNYPGMEVAEADDAHTVTP